jgi:U4/U6.U5 tri-snRNP-associated protein 1
VAHGADDFEVGEDVVLTLKDSRVLGGEEDELQNVNLIDDEAVKAAKERKRKAEAAYTGYDDDEFDENRIGKKADVLGKYDDEFSSGKVRTEGFRLGAAAVEKKNLVVDEDTEMMGTAPATKVKLNLDYAKDFEGSDYLKEGDAGFKKPKKRKAKRSTRRAEADEDGAGGDGMDVDEPTFAPRAQEDGPQNLVDDDDLQAALARSRRANARKKPKVKADDLVARSELWPAHVLQGVADIAVTQRKEDEAAEDVKPTLSPEEDDGRITFDETSEFVRNVSLDNLNRTVKRERTSPGPGESSTAGPSGTNGAERVITISRGENGDGGDDDEDMSEDEDEGLAEMAAREGMSLQEYREKIDRQMQEMSEIKPEDAQVCHLLRLVLIYAIMWIIRIG